jgi:translation initiation factor IF-1
MKPSLLRGTVEMFDGKVLAIRTENGQDVMAAVSDKTRFATVERRNFDQLKPTDFVGITAVPGRNGHLRAEEVHIIPFVGLGEGHYPWDHHPGGNTMSTMGSMTNGTVAPAAAAGSMTNGTVMAGGRAHELHVTYRGAGLVNGQCEGRAIPGQTGCTGTAIVDVPSSAPIAAIVGGTPSDVKPGLAIVAGVLTDADGHVFLASATVEKNGVKPEF